MDEDTIRTIAHRLWEAEGRPDGQDERHWREAEQEYLASSAKSKAGPSKRASTAAPSSRPRGTSKRQELDEPANDWPAEKK